jgi:hypothetical protein
VAGGRQQLVAIRQPFVQRHDQHPQPQRLLAAAGQLPQQLGQLTDGQAVQVGGQVGAKPRRAVELVGVGGSAGISNHSPLVGSVGSVGTAGAVGLAALGAPGPLLDQPLGAFGAASDRGHPPLGGQPRDGNGRADR